MYICMYVYMFENLNLNIYKFKTDKLLLYLQLLSSTDEETYLPDEVW